MIIKLFKFVELNGWKQLYISQKRLNSLWSKKCDSAIIISGNYQSQIFHYLLIFIIFVIIFIVIIIIIIYLLFIILIGLEDSERKLVFDRIASTMQNVQIPKSNTTVQVAR